MAKHEMKLTPDELANVLSQIDGSAGYYSYDQHEGVLHYDEKIKTAVEAADKTKRILPVPVAITPVQMRRAMRHPSVDRKADFDAWLAAQSDDVREDVEYALEIRRDSPLIAAGAAALGFTSAETDALFRLAKSL